MSSDQDYASFLDKANQDTGASKTSNKDDKFARTKAVDTTIPGSLKGLDAFYMSDSDEPFEPVALKSKSSSLDKASFGKLIDHSGEIEEVSLKDWNIKNQYDEVVNAVKSAGSGDVKVFRVAHGATRAEYYVVTLNDGVILGVKAKAVES
ncbi:hypothetical protein MBLNU459_g3418t1 [Dothideomycetes sp. NU459]